MFVRDAYSQNPLMEDRTLRIDVKSYGILTGTRILYVYKHRPNEHNVGGESRSRRDF